jgi:hypothetical protein
MRPPGFDLSGAPRSKNLQLSPTHVDHKNLLSHSPLRFLLTFIGGAVEEVSLTVLNSRNRSLSLSLHWVGDPFRRQEVGDIKACHANPVVGHPIVDVEAVR